MSFDVEKYYNYSKVCRRRRRRRPYACVSYWPYRGVLSCVPLCYFCFAGKIAKALKIIYYLPPLPFLVRVRISRLKETK